MFVLSSTYDIERLRRRSAEAELQVLTAEWNTLVGRINDKGGETFLDSDPTSDDSTQFSKQEIRQLLSLCHPDKHNGKLTAITLTQKLIKLKQEYNHD